MSSEESSNGPPSQPTAADLEQLDELYHKLRGLINALGLCARVMKSGLSPREMEEYSCMIEKTGEQIEKLVQKLGSEQIENLAFRAR